MDWAFNEPFEELTELEFEEFCAEVLALRDEI